MKTGEGRKGNKDKTELREYIECLFNLINFFSSNMLFIKDASE
ncbi:hypothetical protein NEOC65_001251 [Neochlamydia sp. AcF65]|nr:hypothetical protein [Neochlamydia sp. AcF65]MBS4170308.1 hypothetical protein [Neochlamydia sp. AcF95]